LKLPERFGGLEFLRKELYQKNWSVYSKKAFGGISSVLSYLGRYTQRVAISNNRLTGMEKSLFLTGITAKISVTDPGH